MSLSGNPERWAAESQPTIIHYVPEYASLTTGCGQLTAQHVSPHTEEVTCSECIEMHKAEA